MNLFKELRLNVIATAETLASAEGWPKGLPFPAIMLELSRDKPVGMTDRFTLQE